MPISLIKAVFGNPRNPYRGLFPFTSKESEYFFGRTKVLDKLQDYVTNQPVVVVSGASSIGKSSLVFAGLVPRLREQGDWLIAHFRPKNQPFQELAGALLNADNNLAEQFKPNELAKQLEKGKKSLSEIVQQRLDKENSAQHFLLIVDQFEELLDTSMSESERQNCFINQLFAEMSPITLLITLRTEFMSQARIYQPFRKALTVPGREIGLMPMTEDELRTAIEEPAATQGVTYGTGLVNQILSDLGLAPGRLSVLEFALDKLWQQKGEESGMITHQHYDAIGGVNHAIARHADKFYQELEENDKSRLPQVLVQLVRPGEKGTPDSRQIANISQIGADNGNLVCKLAANALVVTSDNNVELVSDALIHHWQRLQDWINEKREFRSWQNRLRMDIEEWEKASNSRSKIWSFSYSVIFLKNSTKTKNKILCIKPVKSMSGNCWEKANAKN